MTIVYITNTKTVMPIHIMLDVAYSSRTLAGSCWMNVPKLMRNVEQSIWAIVSLIHLLWFRKSKFSRKHSFDRTCAVEWSTNIFLFWHLQLLLDYYADHFTYSSNCVAVVLLGRKFDQRLSHLLCVQIPVHVARYIPDQQLCSPHRNQTIRQVSFKSASSISSIWC